MDVATAAEVSPSTVSRVLSGSVTVSPDLAKRVRRVADELAYRPNPVAQGLLKGATRSVGVMVPDLVNPHFSEILKGVAGAASERGYRVLVADSDENARDEAGIAMDLASWADGVILCSPRASDHVIASLAERVPHLVCVNRLPPGRVTGAVVVDFQCAMAAICRHLSALGHHRIAYLQGRFRSWAERERQRALGRLLHSECEVFRLPCGSASRDGCQGADTALALGATAIVAASDTVAYGVLARLSEVGIGVPAQMSVVGIDDLQLSSILSPGLTTVSIPRATLGRLAWECLEGTRGSRGRDSTAVLVPELVVRGSTGRAPAG